uniref:Uncharacterized protein n=1 Tax=uncultured marine virus TaxID=186617 RepID=A0A0F7L8K5_9VIRU|nr:hypothetical protein [uncultured marine virus]
MSPGDRETLAMLTMLYRVPAMTVLEWPAEVQTIELLNLQECLAMSQRQAAKMGDSPIFPVAKITPF